VFALEAWYNTCNGGQYTVNSDFVSFSLCGLVMGRDENFSVNILQRYFAWLGPHTGDPVRCAEVFTAIKVV
jgi:hypothetical protein